MADPTTPMISFDRPKKERLRRAYNAAVAAGQEQFTFEGSEFVTNYAKYLLQHLDLELPSKR